MTYCIVENLREAPKKKKNTRSSKFNKVSGYKINIKKSIASLYINRPL